VKKLLDSIQKNHPAGSLLMLEVSQTAPLIGKVPFYGTTHADDAESDFLVLDGQQRLTSCYCALYNTDLASNRSYYVDLNKLFSIDQRGEEDIDFEDIIIHKEHKIHFGSMLEKRFLPLNFMKNRDTLREKMKSYKDELRSSPNEKDFLDFLDLKLEKYFG